MRTWLTERFGLSVPVVSAPMAGVSGGALAGAVSAAGGLGMIGVMPGADRAWIAEQMRIASADDRPYGVGLLAWALAGDRETVATVLDGGPTRRSPSLVSVSFGAYAPYIPVLQDVGVTVATQAGTVTDALRAEDAGVDLIVLRGGEGGGHGRDQVATLPLLQAVLPRVETPVLAAGGIGNRHGLAAALAAGAQGAWVGTAFLTAQEAMTPDPVATRLAEVDETGTAYGTVFDVALGAGWPEEFGGRALRNPFFERWAGREHELADDEQVRAAFLGAMEVLDLDTMPVYAGQGVGLLDMRRPTAGEVVGELSSAAELLRQVSTRVD